MDPITAITTASSLDEAYALAGREQVERAIRSCSWAIMAAPDLHMLMEEWYSLARIRDTEDRLQAVIKQAQDAATDGLTMGSENFDPYPARASVVVKAAGEHARIALARLKLHDSLKRRIMDVLLRIWELRHSTAQDVRDALMVRMAMSDDPQLATALAFARVGYQPRLREDGGGYLVSATGFDPARRVGPPAEPAVLEALPRVAALRAMEMRADAAGDFSAALTIAAERRDEEVRQAGGTVRARLTEDEARARLDALRAEQDG